MNKAGIGPADLRLREGYAMMPSEGWILPELLLAGDFIMKAGWVLKPRALKQYEVIYFPVGSGTEYEIGGRSYRLNEPCYVITRPGIVHTCRFDLEAPTRHLFVRFAWKEGIDGGALFPFLSHGGPDRIPADRAPAIPLLLQRLLELNAGEGWNRGPRSRMLFCTILGELEELVRSLDKAQADREIPGPLVRAREYLLRNLSRSSLTVVEVAASVGWSHEHFSRQYVRYFGISPRAAILRERIELACQLILQENWTMKEIAYRAGFEDEHYFSRCFRAAKGISPTRFRKKFAHPRYLSLAQAREIVSPYPVNQYFHFE